MIPLAEPTITGREMEYVGRCLQDGWLSSVGPMVDEFEARLADRCGRAHSVAVSSGTAALHLGLMAVGVQPGDLVLAQTFTFVATAHAVSLCGAEPIFVDSDLDTWNMGPAQLQAVLSECDRTAQGVIHRPSGRRIAAVVPVLILGICADIDAVCTVAAEWDLPVVVDAAEALGALFRRSPGTTRGLVSCVSFNGNKVMSTGSGGAVLTDDAELARRCRHLATQAKSDGLDHIHDEVGYNYRMAAVNAAIGLAQLDALDEFLAAKAAIADRYRAAFAGHPVIRSMPQPPDHSDWPWLFSVRLFGKDGRAAAQHLNAQGIGVRRLWRPLNIQPAYAASALQELPNAARLYAEGLSLPSSVRLTQADQKTVVDALLHLYAENVDDRQTGGITLARASWSGRIP